MRTNPVKPNAPLASMACGTSRAEPVIEHFGGINHPPGHPARRVCVHQWKHARPGDNRCDSRIGRCDGEGMATAERW